MSKIELDGFADNVKGQVALLKAGKPLQAFNRYFATSGKMYANGALFAKNAAEGRQKQEPYMNAAKTIEGNITDLLIEPDGQLCVFCNLSSFTTHQGKTHQINGLCWQQWDDGKIVEEQYFDSLEMQKLIDQGILQQPKLLLAR